MSNDFKKKPNRSQRYVAYLWISDKCYSNNANLVCRFESSSISISSSINNSSSIKMAKRSEMDEASGSQASEKPKVFTALHRDPKYRKANAEFLTRRLRLEFDKLTTARPLCKGVSSIPPLPPELQKYRKFNFRTNAKKSRKRSNFSQNICTMICNTENSLCIVVIGLFFMFVLFFSIYKHMCVDLANIGCMLILLVPKNFHRIQKCGKSAKNFAKHWFHLLWRRKLKSLTMIHFRMPKNGNCYDITITSSMALILAT